MRSMVKLHVQIGRRKIKKHEVRQYIIKNLLMQKNCNGRFFVMIADIQRVTDSPVIRFFYFIP